MNIGGGEAADQLVRMMLSGSEVAVRLSGSAIKNMLALTMALARLPQEERRTLSMAPAKDARQHDAATAGKLPSSGSTAFTTSADSSTVSSR